MHIVKRLGSRIVATSLLLCLFAWNSLSAATTTTDEVTVSATSPTASETGQIPGVFTFRRTGSTGPLIVDIDTSTGSATSASDYTILPTSVTFPDTQQTVTLSVSPIDDGGAEGGETVVVNIRTPVDGRYIPGDPSGAQISIADNDMTASMRVPQRVVYEPFSGTGSGAVATSAASIFRVELSDEGGAPTTLPFASDGKVTVNIAGSATLGTDYDMFWVLGTDSAFSSGQLLDSGRRSLNATVVGGTIVVLDGDGNPAAFKGNQFTVTAGSSRSGAGIFRAGDVIAFPALGTKTYVITSAIANSGNYNIVLNRSIPQETELLLGADVQTAIPISAGTARFQLSGFYGYSHLEFECQPRADTTIEGRESVRIALEASNDFAIKNPTADSGTIADTSNVLSIALVRNTTEGGAAGLARVTAASTFGTAISIPFSVTSAFPSRYSIPNTVNGDGSVVLPAGQTFVDISLTALVTPGDQQITTAVITLTNSLDYALAGSGSSSLNPSATINIAEAGTPIVVVPPPGGGGGTGGTGGTVTVPSSKGSSSGCGSGSGLAAVGLIFMTLMFMGGTRRG